MIIFAPYCGKIQLCQNLQKALSVQRIRLCSFIMVSERSKIKKKLVYVQEMQRYDSRKQSHVDYMVVGGSIRLLHSLLSSLLLRCFTTAPPIFYHNFPYRYCTFFVNYICNASSVGRVESCIDGKIREK